MNFAQRLKNARENAHILQKELSERSGVALRTIQNWETGVRRPSNIENVTKVAKVLGVSTSELIDSEEEFVISANEKYGPRGKKGAETVLTEVRSLFAGDERRGYGYLHAGNTGCILESESGESGKVYDEEKQAATFAIRQIRYNTGGLS